MNRRILIFDSGVGGLSIARAVRVRMPDADVVYAADNAGFPYGDWEEHELTRRICDVVGRLIEETAAGVAVIACNTASTVALEHLRCRFEIPFVGTVPAIKPASQTSQTGIIGLLATPGTVEHDYTRALVDTFASHRQVILHGCRNLADMAERALKGAELDLAELLEEIKPVFKVTADGRRTDTVVLGCTHYPLIAREIEKACPWPVRLVDPSEAVARQVEVVSKAARFTSRMRKRGSGIAYLTASNSDYHSVFAREGFGNALLVAA